MSDEALEAIDLRKVLLARIDQWSRTPCRRSCRVKGCGPTPYPVITQGAIVPRVPRLQGVGLGLQGARSRRPQSQRSSASRISGVYRIESAALPRVKPESHTVAAANTNAIATASFDTSVGHTPRVTPLAGRASVDAELPPTMLNDRHRPGLRQHVAAARADCHPHADSRVRSVTDTDEFMSRFRRSSATGDARSSAVIVSVACNAQARLSSMVRTMSRRVALGHLGRVRIKPRCGRPSASYPRLTPQTP